MLLIWIKRFFGSAVMCLGIFTHSVVGQEAGDVQVVGPEAATDAVVPRASFGQTRTLVQTFWNRKDSVLERHAFELFDPFADRAMDVFWEPRHAADMSRVDGDGVVTWREPDAPRYGRDGLVAQYSGTLKDGRAQGVGTFVNRDGLRYDGQWLAGLMDGQGHLRRSNGDVYIGSFVEGRPEGRGTYIAATGETYEGEFRLGQRDGQGHLLSPTGQRMTGSWTQGQIINIAAAGSDGEMVHKVQLRTAPEGLSLSLAVGGPAEFCCYVGPPSFGYTSVSRSDRLEIFPDAPEMLDTWRGRRNIVIQDHFAFEWDRAGLDAYNFLNYHEKHIKTVPVRFGLENRRNLDQTGRWRIS